MAGRLPKTADMKRIHTHMPPLWAKAITKAATLKGVSRSNYIANAAYKTATDEIAAAAVAAKAR